MLLEVSDVAIRYGTAEVLHGVSLSVGPGEIEARRLEDHRDADTFRLLFYTGSVWADRSRPTCDPRSRASPGRVNTIRKGLMFAEVGPSLASSQISCNCSSVTGPSVKVFAVRASVKRRQRPRSSSTGSRVAVEEEADITLQSDAYLFAHTSI